MADVFPDELARDWILDALAVDTLKTLAIDAVEKANSGHPGMPMGAAPMAHVLWTRHLKYDPADPSWPDRDRFILSAGHGSMLLYALLHLAGYGLGIEELEAFRQWGSRTPGHPEYGHTPGVETTTGPLGAGCSNAVGMAIAEAFLAATFNRPGYQVVDHYTYALVGDGDLMEGVSARGRLPGRSSRPGQAHLSLRRQPDLHRGLHRPGFQRGRGHALRGLRVAGAVRRQRPGPCGDRRGHRRGPGRDDQTLAHQDPHGHRLR